MRKDNLNLYKTYIMRKIFVITSLLFLSLFLKNEKAICKAICKTNAECPNHSRVKDAVLNSNAKVDVQFSDEIKQYDGFFFKI